jgi:hypothetical protein
MAMWGMSRYWHGGDRIGLRRSQVEQPWIALEVAGPSFCMYHNVSFSAFSDAASGNRTKKRIRGLRNCAKKTAGMSIPCTLTQHCKAPRVIIFTNLRVERAI